MRPFALFTLLFSAALGTGMSTAVAAEKITPHAPYQKPGAAIRLAEPQQLTLQPHSESQTNIRFSTPKSGTLTIRAKPGPTLTLDDAQQHRFDLSKETPQLSLSITTEDEGQHHIMFHASIEENGLAMSRVFGIPVQVGKPSAPQSKTESHAPYVIMKAEETIR